MNNAVELSLESEAFNAFKADFKQLLNSTLNTMQQKDVENASITAKFEISLQTGGNPNLRAPDSEDEREIIMPMFKHKITAAMQLKAEKSGFLGGPDFELVWDRNSGTFAMIPIGSDQTSIFDELYEDEEGEEE